MKLRYSPHFMRSYEAAPARIQNVACDRNQNL
jgi:hypothetical protein